jgi:cytochrome c oxidase cbb3-type subunit 3
MRRTKTLIVAMSLLGVALMARAGAQQPTAPQEPAGRGTAAGRGRVGGQAAPTFPEQMRPPGDPAVIARGKSLYEINCARCHGADLRGGDLGGPNLLRSQVVMNDQTGEHILPIVQSGRPNSSNPSNPPMPPFTMPREDVSAIAAYMHSVTRLLSRTGVPTPGAGFGVFNRLTGDAAAGQKYFAAKCASCHSPAGDLKGIGSRLTDPMELQNYWVAGGAVAPRGGGAGRSATAGSAKPVTVTVTMPSGQKIEGRLVQADDFVVSLVLADGSLRSVPRSDASTPKVEINDPKAPHKKLLPTYTDKDIHDVTAYLATLK